MVKRSDKYKSIKRYKKNCRRLLLLSLLLTITGVVVADYSINKLMNVNGKIKVISIEKVDSKFEVNIMNCKFQPNSEFIAKLADQIKNILN
jgi:hypothetical protein